MPDILYANLAKDFECELNKNWAFGATFGLVAGSVVGSLHFCWDSLDAKKDSGKMQKGVHKNILNYIVPYCLGFGVSAVCFGPIKICYDRSCEGKYLTGESYAEEFGKAFGAKIAENVYDGANYAAKGGNVVIDYLSRGGKYLADGVNYVVNSGPSALDYAADFFSGEESSSGKLTLDIPVTHIDNTWLSGAEVVEGDTFYNAR